MIGHRLAVFALFAAAAAAAPPEARRLDAAFRLIREAVEKQEVPGAIALVSRGERTLRHEAFGFCDPETRVPFTTSTLCWMASITKPVTATAAMLLVQEGRIALDDPVEKHLPEFESQRAADGRHYPFTIRHLMTHASGLGSNPPTRGSGWAIGGALKDEWLSQRLPDIVAAIAQAPLLFPPGSKVQYSNQAPFVLARVIEVRSGQPFAGFAGGRLLRPLGIKDSTFAPGPAHAGRVSPIYGRRKGELINLYRFKPELPIVNTAPDGGLYSNPGELIRFVRMFLRNDGKLLSQALVREMLTEQAPGWGLGWAVKDGVHSHSGSSGTHAWFDTRSGLAAILFFQFRDDKGTIERLQNEFWQAVKTALDPASQAGSK